MKRDWDFIRELLTDVEEDRDVLRDAPDAPEWTDDLTEAQFIEKMDAYRLEEERIFGHLQLVIEAGFIEGLKVTRGGGQFVVSVFHPRLTMAGHDFLDNIRSKTTWNWVKSTAKTKGLELTVESIKTLGSLALKALLQSQ